ncbi:MAG: Cys-tRNA(Pro) deacylase [Anaerovoracaceae bacterium]
MTSKLHKTNAVRIAHKANIPYILREYDAPTGFLDGVSVAAATGMNPDQVFKTLVLQGTSKEYYVCLIPVAAHLHLKKAAKHFGEKKMEMIPAREITKITGYIKGGCSPVGMKKTFKTAIDSTGENFEFIIVSGGKVGLQMEIELSGLLALTDATLTDLTQD